MKRVLTVLVFLSGAYILHAEQMTFVTTLSSPLGTFAQLETADYSATTSVPLLNFCNTRASVGTVTLKGANSYLQTLSLKNGTTLGGNTPEYRISGTLAVNAGGEVEGGRLLANTATVSGASSAKSKVEDTLYAASLKVKGAKTAGLTIPGQVQTSGQGGDDELEWSNIYTKDYKSDGSTTGSNSYTSYLLKSKGGTVVDCSTGPEGRSKKVQDCSCGGALYAYWSTSKCAYVPEEAVEFDISCRMYNCSSDDGNHIRNSGCKRSDGMSVDVDLYVYRYDFSFVYEHTNTWQWEKADTLSSVSVWTESCGWPDGLWLNDNSCIRGFALDSSGAQEKTVTCGNCQYLVTMDSDSSDEDWGSSYCYESIFR